MIQLKTIARKCPFCDAKHQTLIMFEVLLIGVCSLVSEVVYFEGFAAKNVRLEIKNQLLGK